MALADPGGPVCLCERGWAHAGAVGCRLSLWGALQSCSLGWEDFVIQECRSDRQASLFKGEFLCLEGNSYTKCLLCFRATLDGWWLLKGGRILSHRIVFSQLSSWS